MALSGFCNSRSICRRTLCGSTNTHNGKTWGFFVLGSEEHWESWQQQYCVWCQLLRTVTQLSIHSQTKSWKYFEHINNRTSLIFKKSQFTNYLILCFSQCKQWYTFYSYVNCLWKTVPIHSSVHAGKGPVRISLDIPNSTNLSHTQNIRFSHGGTFPMKLLKYLNKASEILVKRAYTECNFSLFLLVNVICFYEPERTPMTPRKRAMQPQSQEPNIIFFRNLKT
jgi:hypothetical protein